MEGIIFHPAIDHINFLSLLLTLKAPKPFEDVVVDSIDQDQTVQIIQFDLRLQFLLLC